MNLISEPAEHPAPWSLSFPNARQTTVLDAEGSIVFTTTDRGTAELVVTQRNHADLAARAAAMVLSTAESITEADSPPLAEIRAFAIKAGTELHLLAASVHQNDQSPGASGRAGDVGLLTREQIADGEFRQIVDHLCQARSRLETHTGMQQRWLEPVIALATRRLNQSEDRCLPSFHSLSVTGPQLDFETTMLIRRFAQAVVDRLSNDGASLIHGGWKAASGTKARALFWEWAYKGDPRYVAALAAVLWHLDEPTDLSTARPETPAALPDESEASAEG